MNDPVGLLAAMPPDRAAAVIAALTPAEQAALTDRLTRTADTTTLPPLQDHQQPPPGDWRGWLFQAGRDAGKTFAGMHWLAHQARTRPGLRGRIIAPTLDDAILSCVEGPSGLLTLDPTCTYNPSVPGGSRVSWPNGSVVWPRGTPTPRSVDRLRALTNIDVDVFEEAAANPNLAAAAAQAGLSRRRAGARWIATTTPQPLPTIKAWHDNPTVTVTRAGSRANRHGDEEWLAEQERLYAGTRLYRQELLGEIVDDVVGARWRFEWLDRSRVTALPDVPLRWAVGVDPASGTGTTGIVAAAIDPDGHVYVTDDASTAGSPAEWAGQVATMAAMRDAVVVAEKDQGGRMVREVLEQHTGGRFPVKAARARSVGDKATRADAVAILWEKAPPEAHLVGAMPALEDQLTGWVPDRPGAISPDRLDAMVWAVLWLRTTVNAPVAATVPEGTFGGW